MPVRARLPASVMWLAGIMFIVQNVTAQMNTGEIDGTVHDALGGAVPGAAVTITHTASGLTRERTSDSAGRFLFSEVPIGEYVLSVELTGFRKVTGAGIPLNVGQRLAVPIVLPAR